jgi:class 3 adenylate cyclase
VSACPGCGTEVTPDQRFCMRCGTSLASASCPSCSAKAPAGARFCGQCGSPLEVAAAALRPAGVEPARGTERRLVSVLFADLVGFTTRSEAEDPEAVREFLTAYFDRAAQVIERYGGQVEKFIGDAVMAVWGTPTAHEDDAERAVRAAMELTEIIGAIDGESQLRAAVMTGEAAVSPAAVGQALVAGDLVNTSSRLQGAARPGQVLVDETTMVAAGRAVAFDLVGELTLKGKAEPVRAWAALAVVAERGGEGRRSVLEPPFVGRSEELRLLKDSMHAPGRDGSARLVTVIGQAGIGKSRLGWELKKYSDGVTEDIYWHEGQSPAYGEGVAYWALAEMVRARCRIDGELDAEEARARLATNLQEYVPEAGKRAWIEPRLGALLGIAEAPAGDRDELFAAWRTFFERIAEHGTVALIFEDLHWGDDSLLDFIEHLLEWSADRPIYVVCLARPELLERRPTWGAGLGTAVTLNLAPLSDEHMGDLLRGLVPGCPEGTVAQVVERAEGVPLYAVETVRMLIDEGRLVRDGERYRLLDQATAVAVPASLQALITARLDGLGTDERSIVQDAAVLGKNFSRAALAAMGERPAGQLDPVLQRLTRKQIIATEGGTSGGERVRYAFVQGLLRDVAYGTLSRRDRRRLHLAAAQHYATLHDDELVGLVANHYHDAYLAMPDGEDGAETARLAEDALVAAAERSVDLHANQAALTFIEQALGVITDPAERARLQVLAAEPAWAAAGLERGTAYLQPAIDWYLAEGREREADDAIAKLAGYLLHTEDTEGLRELLEARVARLDDAAAGPEGPRLLNELARSYLFGHRVEQAFEPLDRGLAIAERLLLEPEMAELFATKSWASGLVGRHQESILLAEGSVQIAQRHGMVTTELRARMNLSDLYIGSEPRRGFEVAAAGVELAERVGHASWAAALAGNQSFAALVLGEWEQVISNAERYDRPQVTPYARLGLTGTAAVARRYLGREGQPVPDPGEVEFPQRADEAQSAAMLRAYQAWEGFAGGDLDAVDRLAVESTEGTANFGEAALALCQAVHADIWLGDRDRIAAVVEAVERHGWAGLVKATTIRQGRAALAAIDGDHVTAEQEYREIIVLWRSLEMLPDVAVAEMELLQLLGDRLDDADAIAQDARETLSQLQAEPLLRRLDDLAPTTISMEVAT